MRKRILGAIVVIGSVAAVTGGAIALAGNDSEGGVTGPQADRAIRAALAATGGGTASAVERDSESGGSWEVEVRRPDGGIVDVRLDDRYRLVVVEGDQESSDRDDARG